MEWILTKRRRGGHRLQLIVNGARQRTWAVNEYTNHPAALAVAADWFDSRGQDAEAAILRHALPNDEHTRSRGPLVKFTTYDHWNHPAHRRTRARILYDIRHGHTTAAAQRELLPLFEIPFEVALRSQPATQILPCEGMAGT